MVDSGKGPDVRPDKAARDGRAQDGAIFIILERLPFALPGPIGEGIRAVAGLDLQTDNFWERRGNFRIRHRLRRPRVIQAAGTLQKDLQAGLATPDSKEEVMGFVLKRGHSRGFAGNQRNVDGGRGREMPVLLAMAKEGRTCPIAQCHLAGLQRKGARACAETEPRLPGRPEEIPDRLQLWAIKLVTLSEVAIQWNCGRRCRGEAGRDDDGRHWLIRRENYRPAVGPRH